MNLNITNEDCLELLVRTPDKFYSLAIIDPPYGIRAMHSGGKPVSHGFKQYKKKMWDHSRPDAEYFEQLFRVSKNQIIWGANYFTEYLPPSMGWIFWDKGQRIAQSDGELAFTSFERALRVFTLNRMSIQIDGAIHPTQKPVALYEWLLKNYAKPGDTILDTHMGSGSIAIACYNLGFDLTACELDTDYYEAAMKRINQHIQKTPIGADLKPKKVTLNGQQTLQFFEP